MEKNIMKFIFRDNEEYKVYLIYKPIDKMKEEDIEKQHFEILNNSKFSYHISSEYDNIRKQNYKIIEIHYPADNPEYFFKYKILIRKFGFWFEKYKDLECSSITIYEIIKDKIYKIK